MAQIPDTGTVSSTSCVMQWMTLPEQEATEYSMLAGQARWGSLMKPGQLLSVVDLALLRWFGAVEWSTPLTWAEGLGTSADEGVRLPGTLRPATFDWLLRTAPT
jgi:hypothetical protein